MGALQRYEEWEGALDVADPVPLEQLYDAATLRAMERRVEPPSWATGGWRGGLAGGALLAGMALGVKDALDSEDDDAVIEVEEAQRQKRLEPVSVYLAWGEPAASVAIVRRWLF